MPFNKDHVKLLYHSVTHIWTHTNLLSTPKVIEIVGVRQKKSKTFGLGSSLRLTCRLTLSRSKVVKFSINLHTCECVFSTQLSACSSLTKFRGLRRNSSWCYVFHMLAHEGVGVFKHCIIKFSKSTPGGKCSWGNAWWSFFKNQLKDFLQHHDESLIHLFALNPNFVNFSMKNHDREYQKNSYWLVGLQRQARRN